MSKHEDRPAVSQKRSYSFIVFLVIGVLILFGEWYGYALQIIPNAVEFPTFILTVSVGSVLYMIGVYTSPS